MSFSPPALPGGPAAAPLSWWPEQNRAPPRQQPPFPLGAASPGFCPRVPSAWAPPSGFIDQVSLSISLILQKFGFTPNVLPFCGKGEAGARPGRRFMPGGCPRPLSPPPGSGGAGDQRSRFRLRRPPEGARRRPLVLPRPGRRDPAERATQARAGGL